MGFSRRNYLWLMLFTGVIVHMFNYSCLNIAITAMMKLNPSSQNESYTPACHQQDRNVSSLTASEPSFSAGEYDWKPGRKTVLMGSFSWFMGLAQVIGALLCQKYGGKKVYFYSNLFLGIFSCLMPLGASIGLEVLIVLRCLQGIAGGCGNGVAVQKLIARWVPPNERAKFVSVMAGLYCGISLSFYVNGWIIHFIGWRAAFYTAGMLCFVWCGLWHRFVYENPKDDPRISLAELSYIEKSIGKALSRKRLSVPWKQIFSSLPVIVNTAATLGITLVTFTFIIYMPTYFQEIHGYSPYEIGQFSSIPYLMETVFTILFAMFTDWILQLKIASVTKIRKVTMLLSTMISGTLLCCLVYGGCNIIVISALLSAAIMISGVSFAVASANLVDMSPNFCVVIHGLQSVVCQTMGFVTTSLTGTEKSVTQWNKVFLINGAILILSGLLFSIFGDSTVQSWNYEHGCNENARPKEELLPDGRRKKQPIVIVRKERR